MTIRRTGLILLLLFTFILGCVHAQELPGVVSSNDSEHVQKLDVPQSSFSDPKIDFETRFRMLCGIGQDFHSSDIRKAWQQMLIEDKSRVVTDYIREHMWIAKALKAELTEAHNAHKDRKNISEILEMIEPVDVAYELVKVEKPNAGTQWASEDREGKHIEFSLHFKGQDDSIRLGQFYKSDDGSSGWEIGFDVSTFEMSWLDPQHLIHVSWSTIPQAHGDNNMMQCHLILCKEDGQWQEIFRDVRGCGYGGGWESRLYLRRAFMFEKSSSTLRLREISEREERVEEDAPCARYIRPQRQEDGSKIYMLSTCEVSEWRYRLNGISLEYLGGSQGYDLSERNMPLEGVAVLMPKPEGMTSEEALQTIHKLNPTLPAQGNVSGFVTTTDSIPAYSPNALFDYEYDTTHGDT